MDQFSNSRWYLDYLSCPDCGCDVSLSSEVIRCDFCSYNTLLKKPIDLRPVKPNLANLNLSKILNKNPQHLLNQINIERPEVKYRGPSALRNSDELMSEISKYLKKDETVLDLGCGPRDQAVPIEYSGYKYVGVDYSNQAADFLADAHSLPFQTNTFNCVLSYAVLEHLHNPIIAIQEIERVLKPGGIYIGTVSQGEPFHDSYFHHTPWGVISLSTSVRSLTIKRLWDSGDTLGSLSRMGRYPKIIKLFLKGIQTANAKIPYLAPRRMMKSKQEKRLDKIYRAGSICFVMQKLIEI